MSRLRKFILVMTGVNLFILICFTVCMFRISEVNRQINAVDTEFEYTETESGEVTLELGNHGSVTMKFRKDGVSITESHLYDNGVCLPKVLRFVRYYASREGYSIPRSNTDLIGEYRLHTILYDIGYKPDQTGTLNWDFNEDPRWYVNTASSIIGWCGI